MRVFSSLAVLALAGSCASVSHAAVVYFENFNNTAGSNQNVDSVGWNAYVNRSAATPSGSALDDTAGAIGVVKIQNAAGAPGGAGTAGATANGFIRVVNGSGVTDLSFVADLTGVAISQTTQTLDDIQFNLANGSASPASPTRIAVRIAGNWYATDTTYGNAVGSAANVFSEPTFVFDFTNAATAWRDVTFTPGSALSVSASTLASALPTGDITGIGFLTLTNGGGSRAIDSLVVNALPVPEPAALGLLVGAGVMALRRRRAAK